MTCCRVVAELFGSLQQKNTVLHASVADVADVADFFISTHEREKKKAEKRSLPKISATFATSATLLSGRGYFCGRCANSSATALQQGGPQWV